MKRKYIAPEMKIYNLPASSNLLAGSDKLSPEDWSGGGNAT